MNAPDLKPIIGACSMRISEENTVTNLTVDQEADAAATAPVAEDGLVSLKDPDSIMRHPISQGEAHDICDRMVGIGNFRAYHRWTDALPVWWDRLRSAPTPEERLTCERMINALNRAAGMHMTERSTKLIARNRQRWDEEGEAAAAAEKLAEEAAAIDRWR